MAGKQWKLSGQFMESCNCDHLCPCILTNAEGEASYDHCTSLQIYRIDSGAFGDVRLDGLAFALVIRSGKIMAEGNWILGVIVDDRADEAQRAALAAIASGEAGGTPGMIRQTMVGDFRGVDFRPISFEVDGLSRSTTIADVLAFSIEGVRSKVDPDEALYIDNAEHPANTRIALARASETHVHAFDLDLDLSGAGNNGHFAPFAWAG